VATAAQRSEGLSIVGAVGPNPTRLIASNRPHAHCATVVAVFEGSEFRTLPRTALLSRCTAKQEYSMRTSRAWVVAAAVLLAGCAQPVVRQAYNAEANQGIKQVVVAQLPNQKSFEVAILGHPGTSFGLIGGLVAAADMQTKTNKLTAAVDASQTRLQDHFSSLLRDGLTAQGYAVEIIMLPQDMDVEQAVAHVKAGSKADAVLVAQVRGGFWAAGPTTDYQPRIEAQLRAVRFDTGATVYEDTFAYGYNANQKDIVHIAADPKYKFKDIDALIGNVPLARESWLEGLRLISAQVLKDVERR
jgi:hypothetical protein